MRELLISTLRITVLIAMVLAFGGVSLFAGEGGKYRTSEIKQQQQIQRSEIKAKGEIISIRGSVIKIKDETGGTHTVRVTDLEELKQFKLGDIVEISIEKEGGARQGGARQVEVKGDVESVSGSLIEIKDETGGTHSVYVDDAKKLKEFKPGDEVKIFIQEVKKGSRESEKINVNVEEF